VAKKSTWTTIGKRKIELSNLDKILFPDDGVIKAEVIEYYLKIAPTILAHAKGRPLSLVLEERHEVTQFNGFPILQTLLLRPRDEFVEQRSVSALGVLGVAALVAEVLKKIFDQGLHT